MNWIKSGLVGALLLIAASAFAHSVTEGTVGMPSYLVTTPITTTNSGVELTLLPTIAPAGVCPGCHQASLRVPSTALQLMLSDISFRLWGGAPVNVDIPATLLSVIVPAPTFSVIGVSSFALPPTVLQVVPGAVTFDVGNNPPVNVAIPETVLSIIVPAPSFAVIGVATLDVPTTIIYVSAAAPTFPVVGNSQLVTPSTIIQVIANAPTFSASGGGATPHGSIQLNTDGSCTDLVAGSCAAASIIDLGYTPDPDYQGVGQRSLTVLLPTGAVTNSIIAYGGGGGTCDDQTGTGWSGIVTPYSTAYSGLTLHVYVGQAGVNAGPTPIPGTRSTVKNAALAVLADAEGGDGILCDGGTPANYDPPYNSTVDQSGGGQGGTSSAPGAGWVTISW